MILIQFLLLLYRKHCELCQRKRRSFTFSLSESEDEFVRDESLQGARSFSCRTHFYAASAAVSRSGVDVNVNLNVEESLS